MTAIERLRALSAELWNEAQGASDSYADALMHASGKLDTLIAELGQEVGTVCDECGGKGVVPIGDGYSVNPCGTCYTSPAHTSEARDAARWKWMWENDAELRRYNDGDKIAGYCIFLTSQSGEKTRAGMGATESEAIDAAMRQEGGTDE